MLQEATPDSRAAPVAADCPPAPVEVAEPTAGTGYIPLRKSSLEQPAIQKLWATNPGYMVGSWTFAVESADGKRPSIHGSRRAGGRLRHASTAAWTAAMMPKPRASPTTPLSIRFIM